MVLLAMILNNAIVLSPYKIPEAEEVSNFLLSRLRRDIGNVNGSHSAVELRNIKRIIERKSRKDL